MAFDISPYLSGGRHVVTAAAAFAGGIGVHSLYGVSIDQVTAGFEHIFNGVQEITAGILILTPVAMGAWATVKGTLPSKVADVQKAEPAAVVQAMKTAAPNTLVNAAAEVPGVSQIIATPAIAQATASPKVVS